MRRYLDSIAGRKMSELKTARLSEVHNQNVPNVSAVRNTQKSSSYAHSSASIPL
ncbi:MAG: hypothetical protein ACLTD2_05405 [Ruminococcus sp.]